MAACADIPAPEEQMVDPRMEHVKSVSERVARGEYEVDPSAVAQAILRRLVEGRMPSAAGA